MFVDSHCHLDKIEIESQSIAQHVALAQQADVEHILCVAVTTKEFDEMSAKVASFPNVSVSCGVHPCYDEDFVDKATLLAMASQNKVVAVGETGLDYYHSTDAIDAQQRSFIDHIEVSSTLAKPLIIHTRNAREDTISIYKAQQTSTTSGVLHCFTESLAMAKQALDLGLYISLSGIVTFKSATELQEVAKYVPLDRLLIETDSPWLAPVPYRGKTNQPAYVADVGRFIAQLRGITVDELAKATTDNFYRLFNTVKKDATLSHDIQG